MSRWRKCCHKIEYTLRKDRARNLLCGMRMVEFNTTILLKPKRLLLSMQCEQHYDAFETQEVTSDHAMWTILV